MNRTLRFFLLVVALQVPRGVEAAVDSTRTYALGGRFDVYVSVDEDSPGFRWNHRSRSATDRTRFMLDLRGRIDRSTSYYVKAASEWDATEQQDGVPEIRFDQGDCTWERSGPRGAASVSLYANERRYFTGSLGMPIVEDDAVTQFDDQYGLRLDLASRRQAGRVTLIGAVIDDGSDIRGLGLLRGGWGGRAGVLGYFDLAAGWRVFTDGPRDDHTMIETTLAWLNGSGGGVFVTYQQSGFESGSSYPSGSFDFDDFEPFRPGNWLPANSAAFVEAHTGGTRTPWGTFDATYRFRITGDEFRDPVSTAGSAEVDARGGIYWRHNEYAVNGHLAFEEMRRRTTYLTTTQRMILHARVLLRNGSEGLLRAVFEDNDDRVAGLSDVGFAHAAWSHQTGRLMTALHALGGRIDRGDFGSRFAAETRFNVSALTSVYGRLIANETLASNDALYVRFEFRPLSHVFATLGFGRPYVGDGPYVLEDGDIGLSGRADRVYTLTVRGDF